MRRASSSPSWQTSWAVKCGKSCCQSDHCANIKCAVCQMTIVYPAKSREAPPLTRYTCLACLEEGMEPIDMHEHCWQAANADHWHTDNWLKVSPDGTHTAIMAPAADASLSPTSDDVPSGTILNRTVSSSLAGKSCPVCSGTFDLGDVITQLRCLHGYHKRFSASPVVTPLPLLHNASHPTSCLVKLDRSFECPACKQQEEHHAAVFVRASGGRCISVFNHGQGAFTVLKMKEEIAKEDGIQIEDVRVSGAGRLLQDDEEVLRLPEDVLRSLTLE